jgi:hypothetical protein
MSTENVDSAINSASARPAQSLESQPATDAAVNTSAVENPAAEKTSPTKKKSAWTITEDGCRTEVRLGLLLSMAGVFVWLWQGPGMAVRLYFPGLILLLLGLFLQVRDAQRLGRPGYPTKAGFLLFVGGLLLAFDVMYRESVGGPLRVQPIAPMVATVGGLVLLGRLFLLVRPGAQAGAGLKAAQG